MYACFHRGGRYRRASPELLAGGRFEDRQAVGPVRNEEPVAHDDRAAVPRAVVAGGTALLLSTLAGRFPHQRAGGEVHCVDHAVPAAGIDPRPIAAKICLDGIPRLCVAPQLLAGGPIERDDVAGVVGHHERVARKQRATVDGRAGVRAPELLPSGRSSEAAARAEAQ